MRYFLIVFTILFSFLPASAGSLIPTSGPATPFVGWLWYCGENPKACAKEDPQDFVRVGKRLWAKVERINYNVNTSIRGVKDEDQYGMPEYWTLPESGSGDCEDYALEKRRLLIKAGIPPGALRLAGVTIPNGDLHAVLVVRTDKGDRVLDNLRAKILPWEETGYRFLKLENTQRWRWDKVKMPRKKGLLASTK